MCSLCMSVYVCVYASVCDDSEGLCCFEVNNDRRIAVRVNGRGQPGMMRTQSEHCCAIQHRQKLETRHTGSKWEHKANTQTLYVQTHTLCGCPRQGISLNLFSNFKP